MKSFMNSVRFNFLFIDFYSFGRSWVYPVSRIPYNILRCIIKGNAVFFVDGKEIQVREGDMVYLPQGCQLACHALDDEFQFYSIRFASSVHYDGNDLLTEYYGVPTLMKDSGEGQQYFEKMYYRVKTEKDSRMFWVRGYMELLIGYMIDQGRQMVPKDGYEPKIEDFTLDQIKQRIRKSNVRMDSRIQVVVDYMVLHPIEQYTIKRMSQMAELSESRFRTLFKQQVGKNPLEYLNELRTMAAARKLLLSDDNISNIAYSLGFEDVNYFIRVFKKFFCVTPKQYRDHAQE